VVVLKNRKVETHYARADQAIAPCIAPKVKALWKGRENGRKGRIARLKGRWQGVAVCIPKRCIGRGGYAETLGLNIAIGVARICERTAPRSL
jgi:hypothetical protein